jgi:hypothetical protein
MIFWSSGGKLGCVAWLGIGPTSDLSNILVGYSQGDSFLCVGFEMTIHQCG